ncbi:hypothetical protein EYF80_011225 [Liparis tanakae]|uniref:Uncharacterized protein n=1 Tax=Liparis tanakae TaxID=230148 RepID=A0A4Z2IKQ7_9TELE|nr:hypothetical protein EYF80_011225 [Liparis tanakae]
MIKPAVGNKVLYPRVEPGDDVEGHGDALTCVEGDGSGRVRTGQYSGRRHAAIESNGGAG